MLNVLMALMYLLPPGSPGRDYPRYILYMYISETTECEPWDRECHLREGNITTELTCMPEHTTIADYMRGPNVYFTGCSHSDYIPLCTQYGYDIPRDHELPQSWFDKYICRIHAAEHCEMPDYTGQCLFESIVDYEPENHCTALYYTIATAWFDTDFDNDIDLRDFAHMQNYWGDFQ